VTHDSLRYINILTYITLHEKTIYSGLSKSNFKDHYGDVVITQCLGKIDYLLTYIYTDTQTYTRTNTAKTAPASQSITSGLTLYTRCINVTDPRR